MFISQTTTTHRDADCRAKHKQDSDNDNIVTVQPSHAGVCVALLTFQNRTTNRRDSILLFR